SPSTRVACPTSGACSVAGSNASTSVFRRPSRQNCHWCAATTHTNATHSQAAMAHRGDNRAARAGSGATSMAIALSFKLRLLFARRRSRGLQLRQADLGRVARAFLQPHRTQETIAFELDAREPF